VKDIFKALNDETRREILELLKKEDLTAGEIADNFNISKPSISHHLDILQRADLITGEKKGTVHPLFHKHHNSRRCFYLATNPQKTEIRNSTPKFSLAGTCKSFSPFKAKKEQSTFSRAFMGSYLMKLLSQGLE